MIDSPTKKSKSTKNQALINIMKAALPLVTVSSPANMNVLTSARISSSVNPCPSSRLKNKKEKYEYDDINVVLYH